MSRVPPRHPDRYLRALAALSLATALLTGCHHAASVSSSAGTSATAPALADNETRPAAPIYRKPPAEPRPAAPTEPEGQPVSTEIGLASWYGPPYHNHQAADGSIFDQNALTVAHRELPLGTIVRVTNVATGESVVAKVTDRGPFVQGRTIDLSLAAAKAISVYRVGVAKVKVEAYAQPAADPAGRWCVQIGVFLDANDSIQLKNDLARRYPSAKVIEFTGPTGHWVRINPNPASKPAATQIANAIHIPDADPYLVRLN